MPDKELRSWFRTHFEWTENIWIVDFYGGLIFVVWVFGFFLPGVNQDAFSPRPQQGVENTVEEIMLRCIRDST